MSERFELEIDAAIEADDPEELLGVVIDIAMAAENLCWATERLIRVSEHSNTDVRGNALIAFTHLASRGGGIDRERILGILRTALADREIHVREQAEAALLEFGETGD